MTEAAQDQLILITSSLTNQFLHFLLVLVWHVTGQTVVVSGTMTKRTSSSGSTKKIISVLSLCKRMVICKPAGRDGLKVFNNLKLILRKLVLNTCTLNILVTFLLAHQISELVYALVST